MARERPRHRVAPDGLRRCDKGLAHSRLRDHARASQTAQRRRDRHTPPAARVRVYARVVVSRRSA